RWIIVDGLPGFRIDAFGPGDFLLILVGPQELTAGAVESVEESIAGEVGHDLADLTVDRDFIEHLRARRVEVPVFVLRLLEVPHDLAGIRVERDRARGEEIVARSKLRIEAREGVAGSVIDEVGCRIVGGRLPHAGTSDAPGIMVVLPGLRAGLAR